MARVIHRRKSPPYLLIVFIFLFLLSATLLVLINMQREDATTKVKELQAKWARVATDNALRQGEVAELMNAKPESGQAALTVVEQLLKERRDLAKLITGQEIGPKEAMARVDKLRKDLNTGEPLPLTEEIRKCYQGRETLERRVKDVETERDDAIAKRETALKQAGESADALKAEKEADAKKVEELDKKVAAYQADHEAQLAKAREDWERARGELNKNVAKLNQQVQTLELEKKNAQLLATKLANQLNDIKKVAKGGPAAERMPDGKVMKVLEGENTCYINLGAKDHIVPGLTFSVYPPSGIPETGEGKGKITVTNITENISECRIDKQDPADPIVADDLVANLVFDPTRQYTFVVEGQFDLYGTGQATPLGADEVKTLIRKFNGKVVDTVDSETDFVVMGTEPPRPIKPRDDATEQVVATYNEQMKVFKHYQDVRTLATTMRVPVLNTNRFLALVGYTPSKAR